MCRYRNYYYGTCRHQQTVLFDFCANAQDISDMSCTTDTDTLATIEENAADHEAGGAMSEAGEARSTGDNSDDLPSVCSSTFTQATNSAGSSLDTRSASITAVPYPYFSSLYTAHPLSHSSVSSPDASHDMAGLPLFGGTFRQWMTGVTTTVPKRSNDNVKAHLPVSTERPVQPVSHCAVHSYKPLNTDTL